MQHFDYKPHGVCPMNISFDLDGDTVHNVSFKGGCNGNLQAISRVVEGMTVEQIEGYFKGISCNGRGTSCSDQLATAVRKAKEPISCDIGSFLRFTRRKNSAERSAWALLRRFRAHIRRACRRDRGNPAQIGNRVRRR